MSDCQTTLIIFSALVGAWSYYEVHHALQREDCDEALWFGKFLMLASLGLCAVVLSTIITRWL